MMHQVLTPRMEDAQEADVSPEMLGITGDVLKALGHGVKQQSIEPPRIVQGQGREFLGQSKNHMDVGRREDFTLAGFQPGGLGGPVTFGATAVPTRVLRLLLVATAVALREMPAKGGGAAQLDAA